MSARIVGESAEKTYRYTCDECAGIIEYTKADTVVKNIADYGGGSDSYRFLKCPRCQHNNEVPLFPK